MSGNGKLYESGEDYLETVLMLQKEKGMAGCILPPHIEKNRYKICRKASEIVSVFFFYIS